MTDGLSDGNTLLHDEPFLPKGAIVRVIAGERLVESCLIQGARFRAELSQNLLLSSSVAVDSGCGVLDEWRPIWCVS